MFEPEVVHCDSPEALVRLLPSGKNRGTPNATDDPSTSNSRVVPVDTIICGPRVPADAKVCNKDKGELVPIPTLPPLATVRRSLAPVRKITFPEPLASESPVTMASVGLDNEFADPS